MCVCCTHTVYKKPPHTDRYILAVLLTPSTACEEGRRLVPLLSSQDCGDDARREENLYLVLSINGYPEHVMQTAPKLKRNSNKRSHPSIPSACLPYVAGLGEALRRVCRKHDIRTVFTTMDTLRRQLTRVKDTDPTLKESGVVYRIPCSCGLAYIGETNRSQETCLKEHQAACRRGEMEKSAIAEDTWMKQHNPEWGNISIIDQARNITLQVKEALRISLEGLLKQGPADSHVKLLETAAEEDVMTIKA